MVAVDVDPALTAPFCKDRFGRDTGEHAREAADRCTSNFMWWKDPYALRECTPQERYEMTVKNVVELYKLPFDLEGPEQARANYLDFGKEKTWGASLPGYATALTS